MKKIKKIKNRRQKAGVFIFWGLSFIFINILSGGQICFGAEAQAVAIPILTESDARVSMDFRDADLKDVLKILSQQSGINFIPSEDITDKKITLYLENVPIKTAIDAVVTANGLTYDQGPSPNIFIVRPSGAVKIKTITKMYTLNFAQVAPLSVSATSGGSGGSTTGPSTGSSGGGQSVGAGTGSSAATTGGEPIQSILSKLLSPAGSIVVDQRTNSIIITDIPEQFNLLEEMLVKLDTPTPQIFIEAEMIETTMDVADSLGLEYGGSSGSWGATYAGPVKSYSFPYSTSTFKGHGQNPAFTFGTMTFGDLALVLKAMSSTASTKYLARPKLLTLNNETAVIDITSDTQVGTVTNSSPQTQTNTTSAERTTTGVSLRVTPQVNAADYVTMFLEPSVSRTEASSVNTDFLNPITRSAKVKVMVKDGETVFIGGLLDLQATDTKRKVPFFGDIPVAGALFKSDAKRDKQTEIFIFITPHIVKSALMEQTKVVSGKDNFVGEREISVEAQQKKEEYKNPRAQAIDDAVKGLEGVLK